jgi:hypothetical protein
MSAFLNLVHLVTGMGEPNPVTDSPGRYFTKWVFDDNDNANDGEGDSEKQKQEQEEAEPELLLEPLPSSVEPVVVSCDKSANDKSVVKSEASTGGKSAESTNQTKRSKNQKKKERKKNRNRSNSTLSSDSSTPPRSVTFGVVEEVLFARDQGLGSVPSSGLFPLGFGPEEARVLIPVDLHVSSSQVKLIERAQRLGISMEQERGGGGGDKKEEVEFKMLETRQFDYRRGKNPLFRSSTEDER